MSDASVTEKAASSEKQKLLELLRKKRTTRSTDQSRVTRVSRQERNNRFPLSQNQDRMWAAYQLANDSSAFNVVNVFNLAGTMNEEALTSAFHQIVARHEAFQTTFNEDERGSYQQVGQSFDTAPSFIDCRADSREKALDDIRRRVSTEVNRPFDLTCDQLLRVNVYQVDDNEWILALCAHHIVTDGWSMDVLLNEIAAFYNASVAGQPLVLNDIQCQYADYAVWEQHHLKDSVVAGQTDYWKKRLEGATPLDLPTDRPRPPRQTYPGHNLPFKLSRELTKDILDLASTNNASLFMIMMSLFQILLAKHSRHTDISVGTAVSNRKTAELEPIVGFFVNLVIIRGHLDDTMTFREFLGQVKTSTLDAFKHQDISLHSITDQISISRDQSRSSLYQANMVLQNFSDATKEIVEDSKSDSDSQLAGLDISTEAFDTVLVAHHDITLDLALNGDILAGVFNYNTDLFDEARMTLWSGHLQELARQVSRNPDVSLSQLCLLTPGELKDCKQWNATETERPAFYAIHDLVARHARSNPDRIAVSDRTQQLTYGLLNERSNQLARHLQERGVGREDVVGLSVARSPDMLVAMMAILKAGAAFLPMDPTYSSDRLTTVIESSRISTLIADGYALDRLPSFSLSFLEVFCIDEDWDEVSQQDKTDIPLDLSPDNLAYVIYTSGTTGTPKGVEVSHRGIGNLADSQLEIFGLTEEDRVMQIASLGFDACVWDVTMALISSGSLQMMPMQDAFDANLLAEAMRDQAVTIATLTPSLLTVLNPETASHLRTLVAASEPCPPAVIEQWGKGREFYNCYGPTEATVCATYERCSTGHQEVSIGGPLPNMSVRVLDANLLPVPIGVPGELCISSIGLARGYRDNPRETATRYIPDPLSDSPGAILFRTGDLVSRRPDGKLRYFNRLDQQIKVRGFRIELGEIEYALEKLPCVNDATVVISSEDAQQTVSAFVVVSAGTTSSHVRKALMAKVPSYMVPAHIVVVPDFPTTPHGKVDRPALLALGLTNHSSVERVEPRNELETALAQMWCTILEVEAVGVTDEFFDIGGHSLLAIRLVAEIEEDYGRRLTIGEFHSASTIEKLAALLESDISDRNMGSCVPLNSTDADTALHIVHAKGGDIQAYRELSTELNEQVSVYGYRRAEVAYEESVDWKSIESMATEYVAELKTVQPTGPYYLGGWSLGGIVALEMAIQLKREGDDIAYLGLYDSNFIPEADKRALEESLNLPLSQIPEHIHQSEFREKVDAVQTAYFNEAPVSSTVDKESAGYARQRFWETLELFNSLALFLYEPSDRVEHLHLYAADETDAVLGAAARKGAFDAATDGHVDLTNLQASHESIMQSPVVGEITAELLMLIEQKAHNAGIS